MIENPNDNKVITIPSDTYFERDRGWRVSVLAIYLVSIPGLFLAFGWFLNYLISNEGLLGTIIVWTSFCIGLTVALSSVESLFVIRNTSTSMFVTLDQWRSLRNKDNVNVYYGPGTHISLPWETRIKENNISLEEVALDFKFKVQCSDGIIKGSGSFRLRPNLRAPVTFLNGAAGVASEIEDLIISDIIAFFRDEESGNSKSVKDAIDCFGKLNTHLGDKFYNHHDDVEKRYGINVTDVTVSEMLPSKDVQKTISGLSEATAIAAGTEILLAIPPGQLHQYLSSGNVTQADIKEARDRFMAISGNLEGMDISRNEYDINIRGLDKETVQELGNILRSPVGQAYMMSQRKKGDNKTNESSKS